MRKATFFLAIFFNILIIGLICLISNIKPIISEQKIITCYEDKINLILKEQKNAEHNYLNFNDYLAQECLPKDYGNITNFTIFAPLKKKLLKLEAYLNSTLEQNEIEYQNKHKVKINNQDMINCNQKIINENIIRLKKLDFNNLTPIPNKNYIKTCLGINESDFNYYFNDVRNLSTIKIIFENNEKYYLKYQKYLKQYHFNAYN